MRHFCRRILTGKAEKSNFFQKQSLLQTSSDLSIFQKNKNFLARHSHASRCQAFRASARRSRRDDSALVCHEFHFREFRRKPILVGLAWRIAFFPVFLVFLAWKFPNALAKKLSASHFCGFCPDEFLEKMATPPKNPFESNAKKNVAKNFWRISKISKKFCVSFFLENFSKNSLRNLVFFGRDL